MKKYYLSFSILLMLFMSIGKQAIASHCMGGEITYICLDTDGNRDSFLITLKFYRDCNGVSAPTSATLSYSSVLCGISGSIILNQVPGQSALDITPLCPGGQSACTNSSAPYGVQQYVYQGILVLNTQCTDWNLSWTTCCRNGAITTLSNPGSESIYLTALLNNAVAPCNSSPQFLNTPVPFGCVNQFTSYNHGVIDPDGDSLVFSLVSPLSSASTPVGYKLGFSATNPLSTVNGVTIDPSTGTITFIPNQLQVGVLSVKVEEFRMGVKIGEVVRDIQFIIVNCTNNNPTATGIDSTSMYDTAICPNQAICFDIYTHDVDPFQTVSMGWNSGIPGGTFTSTGGQYPVGTFCWTPTASDIGTHFFTVIVQDDACPYVGGNTFAYHIEVRNPDIDLGPDIALCDGDSVIMNPLISVDFTHYQWTPSTGISNDTIKNPTIKPNTSTTYVLSGTNGYCDASDTITVNVGITPTITLGPDQDICIGQSAQLSAGGSTASYAWTPSGSLNNPNIANPTATPTSTTTYTVNAISNMGCSDTGTVTITVNPLPSVNAGLDDILCYGDQMNLTAQGTGVSYQWEPPSAIVSDPNLADIVIKPNVSTVFTVTATDANGCQNSDAVSITVIPAPAVSADYDTSILKGDIANLFGSGSGSISDWMWEPGAYNSQNIDVSPEQTTMYYLTVTDSNGCQSMDSVLVTVLIEGQVFIPNAFTPNNDSHNDELYVLNNGPVQLNYFRIYNRWGQLVFEGTEVGQGFGWDGTFKNKEQPAGVYTWVISITSIVDGTVSTDSGNITLIR